MSTVDCRSEELGHTAEIGLGVWAPTLPALFVCAAQTLFALILTGEHSHRAELAALAPVGSRTRQVVVAAADLESLLVEWLNELLYLHEATQALVQVESVTLPASSPDQARVEAIVVAWPLPYAPRLHVKAVTYHQLRVAPDAGGWLAEVYLDI
jgi:SHS2 domain-containing protein